MSLPRTLRSITLTAAFALLLILPATARAQSSATTFIAVPDAFPDIEARSLLIREPGLDIVVLRPDDVTTATLAMSLALLDRMRVRHPSLEAGQLIPITGYAMTSPPWGAHLTEITDALVRLERAPKRPVGNLGPGRFVTYRGH